MKKCLYILQVIILILAFGTSVYTQDNLIRNSEIKSQSDIDPKVFHEIEDAIQSGDAAKISRYLSSQTYFSITGGANGYYSANQAYYVLEEFFKMYRVTKFRLDNIKSGSSNPYATGVYYYNVRGKRSSAQVYISLTKTGKSWNISQLTIN